MRIVEALRNPNVRKYIYSVVAALLPVLIVGGVAMPPGMTEAILTLVAAVLAVGTPLLARANTPAVEHEPVDDVDSPHEPGSETMRTAPPVIES